MKKIALLTLSAALIVGGSLFANGEDPDNEPKEEVMLLAGDEKDNTFLSLNNEGEEPSSDAEDKPAADQLA